MDGQAGMMNTYSLIVTGAVFIITLLVLRAILKGPKQDSSEDTRQDD